MIGVCVISFTDLGDLTAKEKVPEQQVLSKEKGEGIGLASEWNSDPRSHCVDFTNRE